MEETVTKNKDEKAVYFSMNANTKSLVISYIRLHSEDQNYQQNAVNSTTLSMVLLLPKHPRD